MTIVNHNDGPRLLETNWYDLRYGDEKTGFSFNARRLRVLLARTLTNDAPDILTAKIAVLTIGGIAKGREQEMLLRLGNLPAVAAHLMFDDGSDSPYCLFSTLQAFDVLPTQEDDGRTDLTCAIYTAAPDLSLVLNGTMPLRIRHTPIPNFEAIA